MGKLGIARTANRPRPNNNRQSTQNRESNSQLAFNLSAKVIILLHLRAFSFHVFTFRYAFSCFPALFCSRLPLPFHLPRRSSAPLFASKRPTSCAAPLYIPQPTELLSTFWAQPLFFFIEVLLALQKAETLKIKRADYYT